MPKNHAQPTQEELDKTIKEAEDIADELEGKTEIPKDETEEEEEEKVVVPEESQKEKSEEEEVEEVKEEEPKPKEEKKEPTKEELKDKLSASARGVQKVLAKDRVINQAIQESKSIPEPTEEELKEMFQDWDVMTDFEKRMAKKDVWNDRRWEKIDNASDQAEKIEKWSEQVDEFVDNPQSLVDNPGLEGKEEEFKEFSKEPKNNNVPFDLLVGAFLHRVSDKPKNKGEQFPTSGGSSEKPNKNAGKLTLEEARALRESDYNKYVELLKAGKIDNEI